MNGNSLALVPSVLKRFAACFWYFLLGQNFANFSLSIWGATTVHETYPLAVCGILNSTGLSATSHLSPNFGSVTCMTLHDEVQT